MEHIGNKKHLNNKKLTTKIVAEYIYSFNYSNYGCFFALLIWLYDWR